MKRILFMTVLMVAGLFLAPGGQAEARMHPGCFQAKKTGPCRARVKRYYYDRRSRSCRVFYWGGCRPNLNNFKTLRACQSACYVRRVTCRTLRCKKGYYCRDYRSGAKCLRCALPPLARPARGCRYIKLYRPNKCPQYKLVCSCKYLRCKPGYRCIQRRRNAPPICVKSCPSCRTMRCRRGFQCRDIKGCGKCLPCPVYRLAPPPSGCRYITIHRPNKCPQYKLVCSCKGKRCLPGYRCVMKSNRPVCIKSCPKCTMMRCAKGYICRDINGCGKCLRCPMRRLRPPPRGCRYIKYYKNGPCPKYKLVCSCKAIRCRPGYRCVVRSSRPICIKSCPTCRTMRCRRGYICRDINGCGKCLRCPMRRLRRPPRGCWYTKVWGSGPCPKYKLTCSCKRLRCRPGYTCVQRRPNAQPRCVKKPCICTKHYRPVCGVNGRTYGNSCMARCARVRIRHQGRCK